MGNASNILCFRCKEQEDSQATQNYSRLYQWTNQSNYSFNIPFKISLKAIIMGVSSQFHDEVELKIPPTLLEVFLRHLSYCCRKVFHDDGFDKINELFNFK